MSLAGSEIAGGEVLASVMTPGLHKNQVGESPVRVLEFESCCVTAPLADQSVDVERLQHWEHNGAFESGQFVGLGSKSNRQLWLADVNIRNHVGADPFE